MKVELSKEELELIIEALNKVWLEGGRHDHRYPKLEYRLRELAQEEEEPREIRKLLGKE